MRIKRAISDKRQAISKAKMLKWNALFSLLLMAYSSRLNAQCAMCRAALEGEGNKAKAEAVNDGIVYLMIIPYLLVGVIFWYIYKMRKNLKKKEG